MAADHRREARGGLLLTRPALDCRAVRPRSRSLLGAALLAAGIWTVSSAGRATGPGLDRRASGPNVVLITLDTTRADHLGAWGHPHARTPALDGLAARGVRFERCDTAAPVTLPSHATLMTGLFPPRHRVRDNGAFVLAGEFETVAERFAAAGWETAAIVSAVVLGRQHGLDQGFASYDDDLGSGGPAGEEAAERRADATTDRALARLKDRSGPMLLWVHYFDPHEQYRPPQRYAELATGPHRLYDGEIAFMDAEIGRLLAALPPETVVLVVGDHGEMLGDQGEATHGLLLGPGARRVPLLIAGPGVPAGVVSHCLARTVDVMPTLLALAGLEVPPGLDGRPLLSLDPRAPEPACDRISYSESFLPFFAYRWYPLRALSDGRALFLQAPRPALFRLDVDRAELRDLADEEPGAVAIWQRRLERMLAAAGESLDPTVAAGEPLSADQVRQLASLGYLFGAGGAEAAVSRDLPDPRQRLDVANWLHAAAEAARQGRCEEALPTLEQIAGTDRGNFPAMTVAAQCLRDLGRREEAIALFRRAAEENPRSPIPPANLGQLLLEGGRPGEGERELRRALVLDPADAVSAVLLARRRRQQGRHAEAIQLLDEVERAGGHASDLVVERGTARAESGDLIGALADFRAAAERAPADPVALENAARAAYALGRSAEARADYEALVRLQPLRGDLWKTLGSLAMEAGDRGRAREAFAEALRREPDGEERALLERLVAELEP